MSQRNEKKGYLFNHVEIAVEKGPLAEDIKNDFIPRKL